MTTKLSRKAKTAGPRWLSADHSAAESRTALGSGAWNSMISNVSAIAKTPSQKASRRLFMLPSGVGTVARSSLHDVDAEGTIGRNPVERSVLPLDQQRSRHRPLEGPRKWV